MPRVRVRVRARVRCDVRLRRPASDCDAQLRRLASASVPASASDAMPDCDVRLRRPASDSIISGSQRTVRPTFDQTRHLPDRPRSGTDAGTDADAGKPN